MIGLTSGWTLVDLFHILYAFIELIVYSLIYGWSEAIIAKCKQDEKQKRKMIIQRQRRAEVTINRRRRRMHERLERQHEEFRMRQQNAVIPFESERQDNGRLFTITRTHLLFPPQSKGQYTKTNRLNNKVKLSLL
jgi:hypothetical protein